MPKSTKLTKQLFQIISDSPYHYLLTALDILEATPCSEVLFNPHRIKYSESSELQDYGYIKILAIARCGCRPFIAGDRSPNTGPENDSTEQGNNRPIPCHAMPRIVCAVRGRVKVAGATASSRKTDGGSQRKTYFFLNLRILKFAV